MKDPPTPMKDCVLNPNGIRVKRCCASCAHKKLTRTTMRWCRLWDRLTRSSDVCDEWLMSKQMMKLRTLPPAPPL